MTTSKAQSKNTNGEAVVSAELSQDHPLKAPPSTPTPQAPPPNWQAEAQRLDGEAKFWKNKYFEALGYSQSQSQVIAMLARPQMEQDARQQAELMAKLAGMQAN